ncbi:MAG: thioredoxin domain-containing protein [Pyrinomonadaceae bacterium]
MKRALLILLIALIHAAPRAQAQSAASGKPAGAARSDAAPPTTAAASSAVPDISADECGCDANLPDVLATVNEVKITRGEIDQQLSSELRELRQAVIAARRGELDVQINSQLLRAEARKRGVSEKKLIEEEVAARAKKPTDDEVQAFYQDSKNQVQGDFSEVRAELTDHLKNRYLREAGKQFADRLRAGAAVKILMAAVTPPKNKAERARVVALVNEEPLTSGDIEDALAPLISNAQRRMNQLREQVIELKINNVLLEQEAQRNKITTVALLQSQVGPKIKTVSETDARAFYEQQKEKLNVDFAKAEDRAKLIAYLQKQEEYRAQAAFAEELRRRAAIEIFLPPAALAIAIDDQPMLGSSTAPVTIVKFTDFQCPSCAQAHPVMKDLLKAYAGKVKLVLRDFPLARHTHARKAAEAAEAAREQGKFWEYVEILYGNQSQLDLKNLKEYAARLNLDRAKFDAALDSGKFSAKVERDIQDGLKLGVDATPALFINGQRVTDWTPESLKSMLNDLR